MGIFRFFLECVPKKGASKQHMIPYMFFIVARHWFGHKIGGSHKYNAPLYNSRLEKYKTAAIRM